MTKILINIASREASNNINQEFIDLYFDLYITNNISTYVYYKGDKINNKNYVNDLNSKGIYIMNYVNYSDLESEIKAIKSKIYYINTFTAKMA